MNPLNRNNFVFVSAKQKCGAVEGMSAKINCKQGPKQRRAMLNLKIYANNNKYIITTSKY